LRWCDSGVPWGRWPLIWTKKISRKGREDRKDVVPALACFEENFFFGPGAAAALGGAGRTSLRAWRPLRETFWLSHRRSRSQGEGGRSATSVATRARPVVIGIEEPEIGVYLGRRGSRVIISRL
jgi:hypothetical protein